VHIAGSPAQIHAPTIELLLSSALPLVLTAARFKGKCNNALYFHGRPFSSKLISLLKFIDAIPRQGSLVSSAGGVMALLDEGGP
jgi:hypothetical protein